LVQGVEHTPFAHIFTDTEAQGCFADAGLASHGHAAVPMGGVEEGDAFLDLSVATEEKDGRLVHSVRDGAGGFIQEGA